MLINLRVPADGRRSQIATDIALLAGKWHDKDFRHEDYGRISRSIREELKRTGQSTVIVVIEVAYKRRPKHILEMEGENNE